MATLPQLPTIDFPTIDFSRLDAAKAVDSVTNVLRDGAYITIGLGVLGAQQAAELAKATSVKVQDATKDATKKAQDATKKAQDLSKQYADKMQQAGEQARTATETFTKQVRGLVGSAA
jgi:DNA-binding ferritin-like protein